MMPTPGQKNARPYITPAIEEAAATHYRGAVLSGGLAGAAQSSSDLATLVAELCGEVRELRRQLAPPSTVILTGADVVEHFKRLNERKDQS